MLRISHHSCATPVTHLFSAHTHTHVHNIQYTCPRSLKSRCKPTVRTSQWERNATVFPSCVYENHFVFDSTLKIEMLHIFEFSVLHSSHSPLYIYLSLSSSLHLGFPEWLFSYPWSVFLSSAASLYVPQANCRPKKEYTYTMTKLQKDKYTLLNEAR